MNSERTITIPANGVATDRFGFKARVFRCIATTGAYQVQPERRSKISVTAGRGFGGESGSKFNDLTFFNDTGVAIQTTYYVGEDVYFDAGTTVTNVVITTVKDAPTYTKATTYNLAAGATQAFNGLDVAKVRKQISITNGCAVADDFEIEIQDNAATAGQWIYSRQSWTNITGGIVKVKNNGAGACRVAILETFYV